MSLDQRGDATPAPRESVAAYAVQVSKAALLLAAEIEKLAPAVRASVQVLVEALVANQKRGGKPAPASRTREQPVA